MSHTYKTRTAAPSKTEAQTAPDQFGSVPMSALRDAMRTPSSLPGGRRIDLADAMRSKMENAFGMDFSGVQMYESPMAADAGANAAAAGSTVVFAPGRFDPSSQAGQALIGHELSHIAAQARGEVRGGGYIEDSALEARADREGAMAAAGETVYSGGFDAPSASPAPAASAPLQADRSKIDPEEFRKFAQKQRREQDLDRLFAYFKSGIGMSKRGAENVPSGLKDAVGEDEATRLATQEGTWAEDWMTNHATPEVYDAIRQRRIGLMNEMSQDYDDRMKERHVPDPRRPRIQMGANRDRARQSAKAKMLVGHSDAAEDLMTYDQILTTIGQFASPETAMGWADSLTADKESQIWKETNPVTQREETVLDNNGKPALTDYGRLSAKIFDINDQSIAGNNPYLSTGITTGNEKNLLRRQIGQRDRRADLRNRNLFMENMRKRGVID